MAVMNVVVLNEQGYDEAAYGFSLSYKSNPQRAKELLPKFAFGLTGENKFLESIIIWMSVTASRFFWSEFDTYRHLSKNSESTLHTLHKRPITSDDFYPRIDQRVVEIFNEKIEAYRKKEISISELKAHLPEGYLQTRQVRIDYKSLQLMYNQRVNHRLPEWSSVFLPEVLKQIQHPEFIIKGE